MHELANRVTPVEDLVDRRQIGWSRKRLIAKFRDRLGLTPKSVGRVLRFQQAIRAIESTRVNRWAELAVDCGYYDQSHLIRDFQEFAGCTPNGFLGLRIADGGLGDPA